ncbi:hypothetical protein HK105_202686 [Polyrhizophydium stewartii]|uniref:Uncharacterized protein n=1 Tax=Polyrhizophydium stewartii TaxID=2732419 RepID=A0ABR4NE69_9FUNG
MNASGQVCPSNFERIRSCPIPQAYSIHLKQTLFLYMLALPFQLVGTMGWSTIPIVFIAAFTLQGIEAIAGEIENPFGYDENDLRAEAFCAEIREELAQLVERRSEVSPETWGRPVALSDPMFNKMVHLEKRRIAA